MRKTTLVFIPLIISCLPLAGCKDYKYDSPDGVIRNRTQEVTLVYGYESKASSGDKHWIKDFNSVVVTNLKKATFTKGKNSVTAENRFIEFSLGSNYSSQSIGVANFKLYDNGYITYQYPRYIDGKAVSDTFDYTFDAELAASIIDQVYEEFDIAKAEEERFIETITLDNFFKVMKREKCSFKRRSEDRKQALKYYDNGEILAELQTIQYEPYDFSNIGIDMGYWDMEYSNYPVSYTKGLDYEGGSFYAWRLEIGKGSDFRWAVMSFYGRDCYEKDYLFHRTFSLDIEQEEALIERTTSISERLKEIKENKQ